MALASWRDSTKWLPPAPSSLERAHIGPHPSSRCFKISKWFFTYSLGFQTSLSALGPGASEPAHKQFKRRIFVPCGPLCLLNIISLWFQSQTFWELITPVYALKVGVSDVEHKPLTPQRVASHVWISPDYELPFRDGVFGETTPLLLVSVWPFCSWLYSSYFSGFFFRVNCFICNCRFVVSRGVG